MDNWEPEPWLRSQLTRIKHSEVGHAAEKDPQEMAKQEIKRLRQSIALITDEITNESQQVLEMSTATNDLQQVGLCLRSIVV